MNVATIRETSAAWEKEPGKGRTTPTVKARFEGDRGVLEAGPFRWTTDLPPALGGANAAPSPTALLLGALAGCAVVFIRETLGPQLGMTIDGVEAEARCDADARGLLGMPGATPDLENLQLTVRLRLADGARLEELARVWHERCPVYLALVKSVQVSTRFEPA